MWITRQSKKSGFTLIELLIVIAIIGILATVASVSLVQARRRARDTKRVSDIQQVRNALLIYSNQRATYPATGVEGKVLGEGAAQCLDDDELKAACDPGRLVIMQRVPGESVATHPDYTYFFESSANYRITFTLEGSVGDLPGGACTARPEAVTCP